MNEVSSLALVFAIHHLKTKLSSYCAFLSIISFSLITNLFPSEMLQRKVFCVLFVVLPVGREIKKQFLLLARLIIKWESKKQEMLGEMSKDLMQKCWMTVLIEGEKLWEWLFLDKLLMTTLLKSRQHSVNIIYQFQLSRLLAVIKNVYNYCVSFVRPFPPRHRLPSHNSAFFSLRWRVPPAMSKIPSSTLPHALTVPIIALQRNVTS